jgi:hypothetical protein
MGDVPLPITYLFPNRFNKRKVRCQYLVYPGIGRHFHTSIQEQDNPVWNGKTWMIPWDKTPEIKGRQFFDCFDTEAEAQKYIRRIFAEQFSHETHVLVDTLGDVELPWFYKEGD